MFGHSIYRKNIPPFLQLAAQLHGTEGNNSSGTHSSEEDTEVYLKVVGRLLDLFGITGLELCQVYNSGIC